MKNQVFELIVMVISGGILAGILTAYFTDGTMPVRRIIGIVVSLIIIIAGFRIFYAGKRNPETMAGSESPMQSHGDVSNSADEDINGNQSQDNNTNRERGRISGYAIAAAGVIGLGINWFLFITFMYISNNLANGCLSTLFSNAGAVVCFVVNLCLGIKYLGFLSNTFGDTVAGCVGIPLSLLWVLSIVTPYQSNQET